MTPTTPPTDFTLRDLYRSLDARKRPEDVANIILAVGGPCEDVAKQLRSVAKHAALYSYMSQDFQRCRADLNRQIKLAAVLFAAAPPEDPADLDAVRNYLLQIEGEIGKEVGKSDFKRDRLNAAQRRDAGIDISRRQYNKRFRLAAKMEDKARRRARETARRSLTLASKSRLASQLTWEQFSADVPTACFVAYYVARCNLRSIFTVNSQARPYDEACDAMMKSLTRAPSTDWFAVAHVMPDEEVVRRLSESQKGHLLGRYYDMLVQAGQFLREVWESSPIDPKTMIVRRGNDSSTWNLMAGAWNKLRDGWFSLCHALGAEEVIERQCFGKVMRLMAADVAMWHRSAGSKLHTDTDVWAALPLPWRVLSGEAFCTRAEVERTCVRFGIDPMKSGWVARVGDKPVEPFRPTPELVHGVVVSNPVMAFAMRKAGIFSGQSLRIDGADVDLDALIEATESARAVHYVGEMARKGIPPVPPEDRRATT